MTGVQTCALPICFPVTIVVAKVIRAKYQEHNNQQSAVCEAVAPRISANDEDRERSLLIKARENYRAFDIYKRIAERVAEAVGKIGNKIIEFFDRAREKQSDNSKTITRINEKIEREKHQSQSHHHFRLR